MVNFYRQSGWLIGALGVSLLCSSLTLGQSGRVKSKPDENPPPANSKQNETKEAGPKEDSELAAWLTCKEPCIVSGPNGDEIVYNSRSVDKHAIILKKPEPGYTEAARVQKLEGTVIVSAVLSATGAVTHVLLVQGGSVELGELAVAAARQIKFKPAIKDGKPVAVRVRLEYTFIIS